MNKFQYSDYMQVIYKYWNSIDHRNYDVALDLMTDDVEWNNTSRRRGRADVAIALEGRPAGLVVRHVISNPVVVENDGLVSAHYVLAAYAHLVQEKDDPPYSALSNVVVADGEIIFDTQGETPKIAGLNSSLVLETRQAAPA